MFSICFPMDANRLSQFVVTKRAYDKMPQKKEFVIATRNQSEVEKYLKDNGLYDGVRLIPYTISEGFNPSKGLNIAVTNSKYPNIIITSPEVCPDPDVLDKLEASLGKNIICRVDDQRKDGTLFSLVHKGFRDTSPGMYFLAMFQKSDIERINGWDEDFMKGYACEDNDFGDRWVRAGLTWELREDIHALHQWHSREETIKGGYDMNRRKIQENRDNAIIVCNNGIIKLNFPDKPDFVKAEFEKTGVWEPRTTEYIKKHLKKGQTFVDVGAQVGYYSILASKLGAKVIAFEPSSSNREVLLQNMGANNCKVEVHYQALSDKTESGFLYTDTTPGQYSLIGSGNGEKVDTVRYDDFLRLVPDFIKIDVEGTERNVLEGMTNVLNTTKPITLIIEDWKNELTDLLVRTYGFNLVTTERRFGNKILTKNQPFKYEPEPFTIHLLSLPHTQTTGDYSWCAFTSLIVNMATMMTHEGHKVILYAGEENEAECAELVTCSIKPKDNTFFVPPWTYEYFKPMNDKIIEEMSKRIHDGDIILQSTSLQSVVADAFPHNISMEYAIGYGGCKSACRVFPCEAWRHEIYGRDAAARGEDIHTVMGYSSDCVVPHMLNVSQFPEGKGDGGYLLFVGRLGGMKGEQVAVETSKRTGIPLKLIGPGTPPDYGEYLGVMKPKERAELMGGAIAVIAPSMFPEPFNLVSIESQMTGTPMITTDWGGFTETVENGLSGYRCSTLNEFEKAVWDCKKLDRKKIRARAIRMYSLEAIGPQYTKFFYRLEEIMPK